MGRRAWVFPLAIAACAMLAIEARADDWDACKNSNPDVSIFGCTAIIDDGIDTATNIATAHNNRGNAYAGKGDNDRAIADYGRAIALNPEYAAAYDNRAIVYAAVGNYSRAIADHGRAIALDPKVARSYYNRGTTFYNHGEFDSAIKDFNRAIALHPKYAAAFGNRGLTREKQGELQKAAADFRKALSLRPGDSIAAAGLQRLDGAEAKATASTAKVSFKHFANTDFAGTLLEKTPANNAADCEAQCRANGECAAFTFNVWNAACFLKSGVTTALLEPSSVSGLPAGAAAPRKSTAAKSMVRYRGRVFPGEPASAGASASFLTCEARCEDDPHCVAFSYVKESRICRQFARAGEYTRDSGIDSGVKRQAGP